MELPGTGHIAPAGAPGPYQVTTAVAVPISTIAARIHEEVPIEGARAGLRTAVLTEVRPPGVRYIPGRRARQGIRATAQDVLRYREARATAQAGRRLHEVRATDRVEAVLRGARVVSEVRAAEVREVQEVSGVQVAAAVRVLQE